MGSFLVGVAVTLVAGFLAHKLGYLSVHDKADTSSGGGGSAAGGGGRNTQVK